MVCEFCNKKYLLNCDLRIRKLKSRSCHSLLLLLLHCLSGLGGWRVDSGMWLQEKQFSMMLLAGSPKPWQKMASASSTSKILQKCINFWNIVHIAEP